MACTAPSIFRLKMRQYTFKSVWSNQSADIREEAVRFWLEESALTEGTAMERARQLLVVCRDAGGRWRTHRCSKYGSTLSCEISRFALFLLSSLCGPSTTCTKATWLEVDPSIGHNSCDALNDRVERESMCIASVSIWRSKTKYPTPPQRARLDR